MKYNVCQAPNCLNDYHARGFCQTHYQALWRSEANLTPGERELNKTQRQYEKHDVNQYWEWVKKELNLNG